MSTEMENVNRVDRVIEEAFNRGELGVIDEVVASDYEMHLPNAPKEFRGPEGFKEFVQLYRTAFPDLTLTVEDRVVGENKIADRIVSQGTHEGDFMGIAPTGEEVETTSMVIHVFEDGECIDDYGLIDNLGLLQQLGVVELPEE